MTRAVGAVLILLVGLFSFHIPHFLFEGGATSSGSGLLEGVFLLNLVGAVVAAVGTYVSARWGWDIGLLVVALSFVLYVAQETVGLPGLPQNWFEPSRILSLVFEAAFLAVAWRSRRTTHPRSSR